MPEPTSFGLFLTAALVLAITPGPGIFYVLARSLHGGRRDGYASSFGTALGGFVHIVAAALGLSAILATSALAFSLVKYAGAAYLIYLGLRTLLRSETHDSDGAAADAPARTRDVLVQGITTEVLNPKTALFFLAFIPHFINPAGSIVAQFVLLGSISVFLNTAADIVVATFAGPIGQRLRASRRLRRGQRLFSGSMMVALGTYVAVGDTGG